MMWKQKRKNLNLLKLKQVKTTETKTTKGMKGLTVKAQRVRHNGVCFCKCVCVCVLQHSIRISFNFLLLFLINYRHYLIQFCHNRSLSLTRGAASVFYYMYRF